ncbi:MAG: HAD-IIIC family phosphatase [Candidatus Marinimicrobia bacterium]|nr:HAD-IIIC family phosphatase [Candidatus Neomarinimicrobiota bacterium]
MSSKLIRKFSYSDLLSLSNNSEEDDKNSYKIGFLRSYSIEVMEPVLRGLTLFEQYSLDCKYSNFNNILQDSFELENIFSGEFDMLIVNWRKADIGDSDSETAKYVETTLGNISSFMERNHSVRVLVHSFIKDEAVNKSDEIIREFCESNANAYLLDMEKVRSMMPEVNIYSESMERIAKYPLTKEATILIAKRYLSIMRIVFGFQKKCLSIDLDYTAWDGILGEDGEESVYDSLKTGTGYSEFWEYMTTLLKNGVILCINSKNNEEDVKQLFENRNMPLAWDDFIVKQINWLPKSHNIQTIAKELNIGADSIVHLDDSEFECEEILAGVPETTVVYSGDGPQESVRILTEGGYFDSLTRSVDDSLRTESYRSEQKRKEEKSSYPDLNSFIKSLSLQLTVFKVRETDLDRISQLYLKTNQFNMTTIRYSMGELKKFISDSDKLLYGYSLEDKFGEYGIIGSYLIDLKESEWRIDSFLMSCRAIGRKVEFAVMNKIVTDALVNGVNKLFAQYEKTPKNGFLEKFYDELGFKRIRVDNNRVTYELNSSEYRNVNEGMIKIRELNDG